MLPAGAELTAVAALPAQARPGQLAEVMPGALQSERKCFSVSRSAPTSRAHRARMRNTAPTERTGGPSQCVRLKAQHCRLF